MVVYWALVYSSIEFIAGLVFFKLFIYEEIAQCSAMYCYLGYRYLNNYQSAGIMSMAYYHGLIPGREALEEYGKYAPWVIDPFTNFFNATERCLEALY